MELKLRNAGVNDAAFLAWLILTAGRAHVKRGIWEVVLNQPRDECLRFLELLTITNTPHLFHHSCYLIAEAEAGPVSGLGGYDADTLGYPRLLESLPEVYEKHGFRLIDEWPDPYFEKEIGSPGMARLICDL